MIKIKKTVQVLLLLSCISLLYVQESKTETTTHETISEIPITREYKVDTTFGFLPELHEHYSCILKPTGTDPSKKKIILHCFPTLEFLEHKIFDVPYISCQDFQPGSVLLGIFDNPLKNLHTSYCFIWVIPPKSYRHTKTIPAIPSPLKSQ